MTDASKREEPEDLSVAEKILLVQDLWDDIARSTQGVDLTPAQREELERRLAEHEARPGKYISWEELKRSLEERQ